MKNQKLTKIVVTAIFTALCCAGTFIQIRMPAGDFVHLGNFVMILAALLLGGISGGIVGSLGMGIYDLIFYISKPSTIIRTFILKFIVGFLVGFIFHWMIKKKQKTKLLFLITSILFTSLFILSLVFFILGDKSNFSPSNGFNSILTIQNKNISISIYIPIFSSILAIACWIAIPFSFKLSLRKSAVLFSVTIAMFFNIVCEFLLRWGLETWMVSSSETALLVATSKIPGSVFTGIISIILSVFIYEPIYKSVQHISIFQNYIDEE